jgi:peroxiredoxin
MLQAEVGSAKLADAGQSPKVGELLRDFSLPALDGNEIQLSEFRARKSLALVFMTARGWRADYLAELGSHAASFAEENGQVLVVTALSPAQIVNALAGTSLPFTVLTDSEAIALHSVGLAFPGSSGLDWAVYVTDRFSEVYAVWRDADGQTLPRCEEIVKALRYVDLLCPECGQSEWPKP